MLACYFFNDQNLPIVYVYHALCIHFYCLISPFLVTIPPFPRNVKKTDEMYDKLLRLKSANDTWKAYHKKTGTEE